jgi:hypothetical protein
VTLTSLRDADAERPMNPGARLLGGVVATPGCDLRSFVRGAGRWWDVGDMVVPAIERDLAGGRN